MILCKQCGVELDEQMQVCPLCDTSVEDGRTVARKFEATRDEDLNAKPALLKHVLWQIACVLLLSGIVATLIIDISRVGQVTWSIYPVTICMILFTYFALMALWRAKLFVQLLAGWIISGVLLVGVAVFTGDGWPTRVALPIVCAVTAVAILLKSILSILRTKGLNVLAIVFAAIAILGLLIESILSLYARDRIILDWSVIVSACLLPVTAAVIFIHVRAKNNKDLQKIFHR
ncbi:MAG TPA: hypothetical protein VKZ75_09475 [Cyclobacteriaceae bacterium]|jgi:hypothetical protein|nr:hypothetical protein [Cyclobacteriaceae bacterium]